MAQVFLVQTHFLETCKNKNRLEKEHKNWIVIEHSFAACRRNTFGSIYEISGFDQYILRRKTRFVGSIPDSSWVFQSFVDNLQGPLLNIRFWFMDYSIFAFRNLISCCLDSNVEYSCWINPSFCLKSFHPLAVSQPKKLLIES